MDDLTHRVTSKIFDPDATPDSSISIKVTRRSLRSVADKGLKKSNWFERNIPVNLSRWVNVEIAQLGTADSVFFVPEHPNVDRSHERTLPTQYVKVNPAHHDDIVHRGDDFEVSFVGMSVAPMDVVGNNEILLCSLTREDNSTLEQETKPEMFSKPSESATTSSQSIEENAKLKTHPFEHQARAVEMAVAASGVTNELTGAQLPDNTANTAANLAARAVMRFSANAAADKDATAVEMDPVKKRDQAEELRKNSELDILSELPTALTIQAEDIPFLHYDPEVDGHDTGSSPDSFVPIPGSKRVYLQRRGGRLDDRDVSIRFTVMEVDRLSEEQLIAIKSLDEIGKSVGKAAATVPYLKFISWILKFANFLGRSALKKVAEPEHVLSKDMVFLLADPLESEADSSENTNNRTSTNTTKREQYGNYLRYGYYFFLNTTVDAKLYAQTGASSQNVPLLLRRIGYNARFAFKNEREFFPMTGVSYAVAKVTRGCSPLNLEQRVQMKNRHRSRLVKLLKKYTGKLENAVE